MQWDITQNNSLCPESHQGSINVGALINWILLVWFDWSHRTHFPTMKLTFTAIISPPDPPISPSVSLSQNSCALQNSAKKCMHLISSFSSCGLLNTLKGCDCGENCKRQGGGALKQKRRSSNVSVLPQHHWAELRVNYSMPFVPRVLFLLIPTRDFQFLFSPPFPIIFTEVGGRGQREKTV